MKTIEYQNTFHSTTARVRVAEEDISDGGECGLMVKLSASQIRRVEKTLCGMSDCHCGSHQNFTSFLGEKDRFGRVWCGGGRIA